MGKFPHKDFTSVLMGGVYVKKSQVPRFSSKKKNPGTRRGVTPVLKLDRRQGSVTNAKTPVRGGGGS